MRPSRSRSTTRDPGRRARTVRAKKINPALEDADFVDMRASRYRYAQPICQPGFLSGLPAPQLPVAGLWVADTSHYYPEDRGISESIDFGRKLALSAAA